MFKISIPKKSSEILLIITFLLNSAPIYLYAQEQNIAESFGLYSKGIEYYQKGKLYEAQEAMEQALRLDPKNEEAQGYMNLVKAEIRMRQKGRLDLYQDINKLKRERDSDYEKGK